MISQVLFCIYVDGLLKLLSDAKVGCYIGHVFVGALAYTDDIVLLASTARVMCLSARLLIPTILCCWLLLLGPCVYRHACLCRGYCAIGSYC